MTPDLLRMYDIYCDCPWCGHTGRVRGADIATEGLPLDALLARFKCSVCRRRGRPGLSIVKAETGDPFSA